MASAHNRPGNYRPGDDSVSNDRGLGQFMNRSTVETCDRKLVNDILLPSVSIVVMEVMACLIEDRRENVEG